MELKKLNSGLLTECQYNETENTLIVTFTNGKRWEYSGVSETEYSQLINAGSIGKHFIANIQKTKEGKAL